MRRTRFSTAVLLSLALLVSGCSDDGGEDSNDIIPSGDSGDDGGGDGSGGTGGDGATGGDDDGDTGGDGDDGGSASGDGAGSSDGSNGGSTNASAGSGLPTVYAVPDGDYMEYLPYSMIDDEFQVAEYSSVMTMDVNQEEAVAFYTDYLPTIGIDVSQFAAGDSTVLNLLRADRPNWIGVVQVGTLPAGYVVITQDYSEMKESTETTTTTEGAEAVSSEGVVSEGE